MGKPAIAGACPARCCECFHISNDSLVRLHNDPEHVRDGLYIREMLIPLTPQKARKLNHRWGFTNWQPAKGESYFTCKHWDRQTRLCKAYEQRPQMCREAGTIVNPCKSCGRVEIG